MLSVVVSGVDGSYLLMELSIHVLFIMKINLDLMILSKMEWNFSK